jgi:hypothetical protein
MMPQTGPQVELDRGAVLRDGRGAAAWTDDFGEPVGVVVRQGGGAGGHHCTGLDAVCEPGQLGGNPSSSASVDPFAAAGAVGTGHEDAGGVAPVGSLEDGAFAVAAFARATSAGRGGRRIGPVRVTGGGGDVGVVVHAHATSRPSRSM